MNIISTATGQADIVQIEQNTSGRIINFHGKSETLKKYAALIDRTQEINQTITAGLHQKPFQKTAYSMLVESFQHHVSSGTINEQPSLQRIENLVEEQINKNARFCYFGYCIIFTLLFCALIYTLHPPLNLRLDFAAHGIFFGFLGAFASSVQRTANLEVKGIFSDSQIAITAAVKIFLGGLFGGLAILLVQSGTLSIGSSSDTLTATAAILAGFLAGTTERMIPEALESHKNTFKTVGKKPA